MVKKIDKAEFIARLDGTLEEKIYEAYYYGFEKGYEKGQNSEFNFVKAENWQINVAYQNWLEGLQDPPQNEEVEK